VAQRFVRNSKRKNKLQLDGRFAAALKDERFQSVQGKYDKYGRRIEKKDNEMKQFYRLEEDEEQEEEQQQGEEPKAKAKTSSSTSSDDDDGDADATVAKNNEKLSRLDYLNRMARGELESGSDSSDSTATTRRRRRSPRRRKRTSPWATRPSASRCSTATGRASAPWTCSRSASRSRRPRGRCRT